jgi:hypothetical protein
MCHTYMTKIAMHIKQVDLTSHSFRIVFMDVQPCKKNVDK